MEKKKRNWAVSPALFVMLTVAAVMWYLTQLSKSYADVEVPVSVTIGDETFDIACRASGVGYRLLAHRTFRKSKIVLDPKDLTVTPLENEMGTGVVNHESLQAAVIRRIADIKIMEVSDKIPEITLK